MVEEESFAETKRELFLRRSRELVERIDALRSRISRGEYDDADLAELRSILRSLRYDIVGNDTRLSQAMGLSGSTIAHTYEGRSRPKYPNFMKMLHGAQQLLNDPDVRNSEELLSWRDDGGDPGRLASADMVRIRPERSSIFLTEADLLQVQNLARISGASISSVISAALSQYNSEQASRPKTQTKRGGKEPIVIRNRVEILRYSTAIITALEEVLDYDVVRHHNLPPLDLRLENDQYLQEVRNLVVELRTLNSLLQKPNKLNARATRQGAVGFGKHLDKFLTSYASALGKGAAGLTIAAAVGLLYSAGVSSEIIEAIWRHLRR